MKIGIDISRYIDKAGGIGVYAANLLSFLLKIDTDNTYLGYTFFYDCFPDGWNKKEEAGVFSDYYRNPNIYTNFSINKLNWSTGKVKKVWERASIEKKEALLGSPDVIHSTAYIVPELLKAKLVVTVHDLSFLLFPEFHTEANIKLLIKNLIYVNSRPSKVICDSEQTKKDLQKFFHVPDEKIKVIYLGVNYVFSKSISSEEKNYVFSKYGLTGIDYILCVSSIEPRKNFKRIISVFSQVIKDERFKDLFLVCAGGKGWKNEAIYEFIKEKGIEDRVKFLGFVEEKNLPAIYNGAKLFLYPSLYEGFGLPVLEAMSAKVPVITSNISSMPEVAGDAAMLVNPYDEEEIYNAVKELLSKESLRKDFILKGYKRASKFTWEDTAEKTLEVYKEVYNETNKNNVL